MELKKPCYERPEVMIRKPIANATNKGVGGRGRGGVRRDEPIDLQRVHMHPFRTGNETMKMETERKRKSKKKLHNKYEAAQPETAAKDGQIAPAPYLERSFLLLPPAPALPPPPRLLQRLGLSAS